MPSAKLVAELQRSHNVNTRPSIFLNAQPGGLWLLAGSCFVVRSHASHWKTFTHFSPSPSQISVGGSYAAHGLARQPASVPVTAPAEVDLRASTRRIPAMRAVTQIVTQPG